MVKYQTHNKNTSVEYTLATDTEFANATKVVGSCYYFCEEHEDLDFCVYKKIDYIIVNFLFIKYFSWLMSLSME